MPRRRPETVAGALHALGLSVLAAGPAAHADDLGLFDGLFDGLFGGSMVPVLLDTGSTGLVIEGQDVGTHNLGAAVGTGSANCGKTLLYTHTTGAERNTAVTGLDLFNTGDVPFLAGPVYISQTPTGIGQTIFDR